MFGAASTSAAHKEPLLSSEKDDPASSMSTTHDPPACTLEGDDSLALAEPYDYLGGIRVRVLQPSPQQGLGSVSMRSANGRNGYGSESGFQCHAFSKDASYLATGEKNGTVRLWKTSDYELDAEAFQLFEQSVNAITFIDGTNQRLVAVDVLGNVKEFSFNYTRSWREGSGAVNGVRTGIEISATSKICSTGPVLANSWCYIYQFSEDGRTLAYYQWGEDRLGESIGVRKIIVWRFDGGLPQYTQLSKHWSSGNRLPVLAPSGRSLFVCSANDHIDVFPVLQFDTRRRAASGSTDDDSRETRRQSSLFSSWKCHDTPLESPAAQEALTLRGHRAIWGKKGDYLMTWDKEGIPELFFYKTSELSIGKQNKPQASKRLRMGLINWKACMIDDQDKNGHIRVLICEIYSATKRRYLIWNVTDDKITHETGLMMPPRSPTTDGLPLSDMATAEGPFELDLPTVSYEGYLSVAGEDQIPKFSLSVDEQWVGAYSWRSNACAIASMTSGATVCDIHLPDDVRFSPRRMPNQFKFCPGRRHFLIFGYSAIYAFRPDFLHIGSGLDSETMFRHTSNALTRSRGIESSYKKVLDALLVLSSRAQDPSLLHGNHVTDSPWNAHLLSDLQPLSKIIDASMSKDGVCLAFIVCISDNGESVLVTFDAREESNGPKKSQTLQFPLSSDTSEVEFNPKRVFIYTENSSGKTRIMLFSGMGKPIAYYCSMSGRGGRTVHFQMETCLWMSQTSCRTKLAVMDRCRICIIEMEQMKIIQVVPYGVDFVQLLDAVHHQSRRGIYSYAEDRGDQRIADDGSAVLLCWNPLQSRSIVVTPKSTQFECVVRISSAQASVSDFCTLSHNAACTCFVDFSQMSDQRITVGVFNEKAQSVIHSCDILQDIPIDSLSQENLVRLLSNVFYGISKDGYSLVVTTTQVFEEMIKNWTTAPRTRNITLRWSAYYASKEEQKIAEERYATEWIQATLSAQPQSVISALNCPAVHGMSAFQEAVLDRKTEAIQRLKSLGQKHDVLLGLEWTTRGDESLDVMKIALDTMSRNRVDEALDLVTSGAVPFGSAATIMKNAFLSLLTQYEISLGKKLSGNALVVEACELLVHIDFVNEKLMRDTAVHIDTTDTFLEWTYVTDPEHLEENWRMVQAKTVEVMEKNNDSTAKAKLKFICIENAAKVGMQGILRPLLLRRVPVHYFKMDVVKWVILFKWLKMWRRRFLRDFIYYLIFLLCFTCYAALFVGRRNSVAAEQDQTIVSTALLAITTSFSVFMLMGEFSQLNTFMKDCSEHFGDPLVGARYYFRSVWNWVDLFSCLNLIVLIPLFHILSYFDEDYEKGLSAAVATEAIVSFAKLWYFAQPFRVSGALVLMVNNIVKDCLVFLLLAFIILVGFSLALHVLFRHVAPGTSETDQIDQAFGTFGESTVTLFYALAGTFEAEIYKPVGMLGRLRALFFILYMISESIVLLNLLIAIMGDTFDRVKDTEEMQLLLGCARFIDACEAGLNDAQIHEANKSIGRYVCALTTERRSSDLWEGKLSRTAEIFRTTLGETEKRIADSIQSQMTSLEDVIRKQEERIRSVEVRLEQMDSRAISAKADERVSGNILMELKSMQEITCNQLAELTAVMHNMVDD